LAAVRLGKQSLTASAIDRSKGEGASLSRLGYFGGSQAEGVGGRPDPVPAAAFKVSQRSNPPLRPRNADR
jgi:hypothetical protein